MIHLYAVVLALVFFALPFAARAQDVGNVRRIGYLAQGSAELDRNYRPAFQQGLRDLGYVEGKNITIEWRHDEGQSERVSELATELVRSNVDVIVVYGSGAVAVVKKLTNTIPIIMTVSADPVGAGLVASLARPGGNVTGLSDLHGGTATKRLQLLKEVVPSGSRIAVLFNPAYTGTEPQLRSVKTAATVVGLTILPFEAKRAGDLDSAFARIRSERADALLLIAEPTVVSSEGRIQELALKHRLPAIGTIRKWAERGLLMSYGTNYEDLWRRAATFVDRILKGAKPGDLPIEQASKWDFVINLKTAKALGLRFPPSLVQQADQVIE